MFVAWPRKHWEQMATKNENFAMSSGVVEAYGLILYQFLYGINEIVLFMAVVHSNETQMQQAKARGVSQQRRWDGLQLLLNVVGNGAVQLHGLNPL